MSLIEMRWLGASDCSSPAHAGPCAETNRLELILFCFGATPAPATALEGASTATAN